MSSILKVDTLQDVNGNAIISSDGSGNLTPNTFTGLTISGNLSVDGGTIKLDGNYPVGSQNVALGSTALESGSLTGGLNTAIGHGSLRNNTTGTLNVAVGVFSGTAITTGQENTAIGSSTLNVLTTGSYNTAVGRRALLNNTASNNTAVGYSALDANTTGAGLVAIGRLALSSNIDGNYSVAIGDQALENNTDGTNVAVGRKALQLNTTGDFNTALGRDVLANNTTASNNTAVGYLAGLGVTTGNNNLLLGRDAGRSGSPSGNITTGSNIVCLGDNSITDLYCADTTISSSDQRDKTDITDFNVGMDWIKQLRPVTYRWDKRTWYEDNNPDGTNKRNKLHLGFLAQEELEIEKQFGYGNTKDDMLVANINEDETAYGIKYERLVPVLVNAIKELSAKVDTLQEEVNTLKGA